jgi:hypothetical protein
MPNPVGVGVGVMGASGLASSIGGMLSSSKATEQMVREMRRQYNQNRIDQAPWREEHCRCRRAPSKAPGSPRFARLRRCQPKA